MECNTDSGCVIPDYGTQTLESEQKSVHIIFVTDPICSHCWAIEPVWRRLKLNYEINERYIHGGLLPGWENFGDPGNGISKPVDVIPHWQHVAEHYQQPIDPSVWQTDPISNSYILCKAAIAVRLLNPELESAFVRKMRERIFLYAENVAKSDVLVRLAESMEINGNEFDLLMQSKQVLQIFNQEQREMLQLGARGFPSLLFTGDDMVSLSGSQSYQKLERALSFMGSAQPSKRQLTSEQKLLSYSSWTLKEACEVLQMDEKAIVGQLSATGFEESTVAGSSFWQLPGA